MKPYTDRRLKLNKTDRFAIEMNMPKEYPPIEAPSTEEGGVRVRFHKARLELPDEITVIRPFDPDGFAYPEEKIVFVSPNGCDSASGREDAPVKTIAEALKRAERKNGMKIVLSGGNYNITKQLDITSAHSGSEETPLLIMSKNGEKARISGSKQISPSAFSKPENEKMLSLLKEEARDRVLACDLRALGITDFGYVGHGGAELLINGTRMSLCRYPSEGKELIKMSRDVISSCGTEGHINKNEPFEIGITDDRCLEWKKTDGIYLFGALYVEWERHYAEMASFNGETHTMKSKTCYHPHFPVEYNDGNNYCFVNVFEELDTPGEWYIDRDEGVLYVYPPEGKFADSDDIRLITDTVNGFICNNAENVIFDRLTVGNLAGCAFKSGNCTQVLIQRCHISGICLGKGQDEGSPAVYIADGKRNGIIASKIEKFVTRAVSVDGGDRLNLIPANNFMQNCVVTNAYCRFGIGAGGCGNLISHNYVYGTTLGDAGHNEGIFEYNVGEGGDPIAHDSGMIYVGGGGCSSCANHYRYNYFFDFMANDYGIYFDDLSRGMYAYGNIVVGHGNIEKDVWTTGGRSFNHHNGGEHSFFNNISIDAGYFAFGGDISYWNDDRNWNGLYPGIREASLDKRTDTYMGRNPTYKDYVAAIDQYEEDRKDPNYVVKSGWAEQRLRKPWCNNYENNVIVRANRPYKLDNGEDTATCLETNFITDEDPGFVDFEKRDYRIRPDAPLYKKIPDFIPIPFEKMGPVDDFEE